MIIAPPFLPEIFRPNFEKKNHLSTKLSVYLNLIFLTLAIINYFWKMTLGLIICAKWNCRIQFAYTYYRRYPLLHLILDKISKVTKLLYSWIIYLKFPHLKFINPEKVSFLSLLKPFLVIREVRVQFFQRFSIIFIHISDYYCVPNFRFFSFLFEKFSA